MNEKYKQDFIKAGALAKQVRSYGKSLIKKNLKVSEITEEKVAQNLYCPETPDPDLIIRTSGEMRLSGFLLWQSAYSEFYFTSKLWPDFSEIDLDEILSDYAGRKRRFGK